ncbi:MAG: hypothetical protein FWC10_08265 [Lentimicrobiaceae bacterium]|nr:hypothetical protein [Lentimicrobiaceae bacterium]
MDGILAVGGSDKFISGDWDQTTGKGSTDAIIVMFDHSGKLIWKKNFGGSDTEYYNSIAS